MQNLSPDTLLLALYIIAGLTALWVAYLAYRVKPAGGIAFLLGPVVFIIVSRYTGMLVAGLIVLGAQVYFLTHPDFRKVVGVYVLTIVSWAGATYLKAQDSGWVPER